MTIQVVPGGGCSKPEGCRNSYIATGCFQTAEYACSRGQPGTCEQTGYTTASSSLIIDNVPFVPEGANLCRSGNDDAFDGVELNAPSGESLRVIRNADLSVEVVAISQSDEASPPLKNCLTVHLTTGTGTGTSGDATVGCSTQGWRITGKVTFQGCGTTSQL